MSRLRQYFATGLLVWLPITVTIWVLWWLVGIFDGLLRGILAAVERLVPALAPLSAQLREIPGLGVILVAILLLATGVIFANIVGQWVLRRWDALMARIPVVRTIYSSVKQVSDTLFSGSGKAFSKALLVEYPRRGSWTIAFLTGEPGALASGIAAPELVTVFVPTTPNPTSGYLLMLPRAETIELEMSVDNALKYVISMGVIAPEEEAGGAAHVARAAPPLQVPAAIPADTAPEPCH